MFRLVCTAILYLAFANACFAKEVLFIQASRNYDAKGVLGEFMRRELETRMFMHSTWRQRLYCSPYEPDLNETLEIYLKSDGSHWLSCRRATPSISGIIGRRYWLHEEFDWKKALDAVRITGQDVPLSAELSNEIDLLWQKMLGGLGREPTTKTRTLVMHAPAIIAFAKQKNSVTTGRIAMAAYGSPLYRDFMNVVDDLTSMCETGARPRDSEFRKLAEKMRRLRERL